MTLSAAMNTALSGMLAQQTRAAVTAGNVANAGTPGYASRDTALASTGNGVTATVTEGSGAPVDLAAEMLDLVSTELSFAANATVFEAGADMWDMLLSIKRD